LKLPGNPSAGAITRTIVRVVCRGAAGSPGNLPGWSCRVNRRAASGPGELTRTIPRVVVPGKLSPGPNPDNMSICSGGAGRPDEYPEQIPQARPRKPEQPHLTARFGGAAAPPATPHKAHQLFRWAFAIVSYWDLFGFYGIFCWCYVNHAIFSTLHKFLQLLNDLIPC